MYELKKIGKVFTSKFVGTGPSSYEKRIYRAAVSQRLRNAVLEDHFPANAGNVHVTSKAALQLLPSSSCLGNQLLIERT